ncbi:hypothetical protein MLD38_026676 [Melastoma candidum]|uniref:Uncharacterized protein n=1 Tax=Melastoma candidum TaxID=119954 RepID=A0ACB9NZ44_9MYRT|nr:hypothetical protein MLD38_026676 [Melastoma candidum]
MGTTVTTEKTEEELRREIGELHRQQREITERLRNPRGLRRGPLPGAGPRDAAAAAPDGTRRRGFVRPAERNDVQDQPPAKRRLLSAVVKLEEGEVMGQADNSMDLRKESFGEGEVGGKDEEKPADLQQTGWLRRDGARRSGKPDFEIPEPENVPRVLPKNEDPSLVNRNKRMLGQLLGTLERFKKEDMQLSGSEAFMRRSNSLQRAEQRAREESEKLRQQEREQNTEKRKQDMILRARIAAKAEEKKLELLFLRWSEHQKKLCNFIRTKTEPPIYYMPVKPMDDDLGLAELKKEQAFLEWRNARREELSNYQKNLGEQYLANVEKQLERWQNARKARKQNGGDILNLQETMDKELDTHRLEHGPKTRKIPGSDANEDEDIDDINVVEDDMMDDVLDADENNRRMDELVKAEGGDGLDGLPQEDDTDQ